MSKSKLFTVGDVQEMLDQDYGIPIADSTNVFSKTNELLTKVIKDNCDVTKKKDERIDELSIELPFAYYTFDYNESVAGIDGEADVPAQYTARFGMPDHFMDAANHSVDWGELPSTAEVAEAKKSA